MHSVAHFWLISACTHILTWPQQQIPWQLCTLAINEVDGLAPTHDANASGGKVDLLSKILSMVGSMDLEIPLHYMQHGGASFHQPSKALHFMQDVLCECKQAIENLVSLMINFSNDTMHMLMWMLHKARGKEEGPIDDAEALEFVWWICQAEHIFLGSQFMPDILESVHKKLLSFDIPMMHKLAQMLHKAIQDTVAILHRGNDMLAVAERMHCTHQLLVDFLGAAQHQFNMQMTMDHHISPEQHQIFA
jgi:hypothetical protein